MQHINPIHQINMLGLAQYKFLPHYIQLLFKEMCGVGWGKVGMRLGLGREEEQNVQLFFPKLAATEQSTLSNYQSIK